MPLNNSTVRVVKLHADERVDVEQLDLMGSLSAEAIRRLQRFIGERRLSPVGVVTDIAGVHGCVINAGNGALAYNTPGAGSMTLTADDATPLELLIANSLGEGGTDPCGEVIQIGTGAPAMVFTMPTAAHPRMILARVVALAEDTSSVDTRRYWDVTLLPPAEAEATTWNTIQHRAVEWKDTDNSLVGTDPLSTWQAMQEGWQPVALVTYGTPCTSVWQTLLPAATDATRLPGGELTSVAQTLAAFAYQLAEITGTTWDALPGVSLAATVVKDAVQDARLTAAEADITAVEADNALQWQRILELEDPGYTAIAIAEVSTETYLPGDTPVAIAFNGPNEYDPNSWHVPGGAHPDRITVTVSGIYIITASLNFGLSSDPTSGVSTIGIIQNTSPVMGAVDLKYGVGASAVLGITHNITQIKYLTSGDYVRCWYSHNLADGVGDVTTTLESGRFAVARLH